MLWESPLPSSIDHMDKKQQGTIIIRICHLPKTHSKISWWKRRLFLMILRMEGPGRQGYLKKKHSKSFILTKILIKRHSNITLILILLSIKGTSHQLQILSTIELMKWLIVIHQTEEKIVLQKDLWYLTRIYM